MSARWVRLFFAVLVVFAFHSALSAQAAKAKAKESPPAAAAPADSSDFPPAELTLGFQTRDSETEGIGDLLVPVWNPGGTGLLFVNPRSAMTDHDEDEGNLGVGYRQLLPKWDLILGANAFYDYRDTGYSHYDQWGFGLEMLSSWVDARANYYDPDDQKTLVASETQTTVSQSVRTSSDWSDPYAEDHEVRQDYIVTRAVTTVTATKTFEQFEQALGGYDWEIGLRLPLQCKALEARLFGGYYDFDRDFGADAKGWKARAEIRLRSSLFLDGGLYENADLTGSDWFAGARLSVPLDLAQIAKGRNPFATAKARLRGEPRDPAARLTDMVMRDPQIRLETSKFIENSALATENAAKDVDKDRTSYALLSDVQFVDGDASGPGDGTGQNPFPAIQQGANAVFGSRIVYVYDASRPYVENVQLLPGTTLWGSSILVPGYDGKTFGTGIQPVVDGAGMGPAITVADRSTVQGFYVRNTAGGGGPLFADLPVAGHVDVSRVGILGNNATDLLIARNTFADGGIGALFARRGDFTFLFSDNLVQNNAGTGLEVWSAGNSGTFNATITRSLFSGNGGLGLSSFSDTYDVNLLNVDSSAFIGNALGGLNAVQLNSWIAAANLAGVAASGNAGFGLNLVQARSGTATANLAAVAGVGNAGYGLGILQMESGLAMAMVGGSLASGNAAGGILVQQVDNLIGLANISGSAANGNVLDGIALGQDSQMLSIGLIGVADGLGTTVSGLAGMIGFPLPAEVAMFLQPTGPVTTFGNGGNGVVAIAQADLLALGGYFDIAAIGNGLDGVSATVNAMGVGIGLGGSSQNWSEILQLGDQIGNLFGVDLPLAIAGYGHMQANGNQSNGFSLQTSGGFAAINAVVGLETIGNGGWGVSLDSQSEFLALNVLARLGTSANGFGGLQLNTRADDLAAIGIIADTHAVGNFGDGIQATVDSPNGGAVLLTLSTDFLRPVVSTLGEMFLGAPLGLPGTPFGPVVASGNLGNGITANVTGDDFAAAVFLDTWADNNAGNGFDVNVVATNGLSIAAIIASDVVLNLVNNMGVLPTPIAFNPISYASASGNGADGVALAQSGTDGAYALLAGIRADRNVLGDGIHAALTSDDGDVYAILVDTDAANNGDDGIDLNLRASGYAISALLFADVDDNFDDGIRVVQNSLNADAFALLSNTEAFSNGGVGFRFDLTALNGDAAVCATDVEANYNGARGAHFAITAGGEAALLVGTNALPLFDMEFSGFFGAGILDTFWDEIPQGSSEFMHNGSGGLQANLVSTGGRVWVDVDGADAGFNTNNGFNLSLSGDTLLGRIHDADTSDNGGNGINLEFTGGAEGIDFWLSDLRTANNGGNGINIAENFSSTVLIGGERIVATNNAGNGVRIVADGIGPMPVFDFGGGALGSLGLSSIYGNGNRDFRYNNGGGATVMAQFNWWGLGGGTFAGNVDHSNPLLVDPNAP